ncbi:MAG: hypothetical protein MUO77_17210 [Anaerolineales bacterium]|nr:hypothetical protein [Anaerolineales bacterium]
MAHRKLSGQGIGMVLTILLLIGCNIPSLTASSPPPTLTLIPTETPPSTRTPNSYPNPVLKVTGEEEVVFDWTTDRCEKTNLADLPVRAFRDVGGQTHLILSHFVNYRMIGPDLNHLTIDCNLMMPSQYDPDPSLFSDAEWIASPYTEDGNTIYALVHNEYQGHTHPGKCPQGQYFPCWDNSITLVVSKDGGKTFSHALTPPSHLVARLPYPYEAGAGPDGTRNPSNIIKGKDGYYYNFFNVSEYRGQNQWVCLMRTNDLSSPASWRFWDGDGFDGQFADPYLNPPANPSEHLCPALEWNDIGASLNDSITYNTYLDRYVLVGISADTIGGREIWGVFYSFSDDLIHWTHRKLLREMILPWTAKNNTDVMYLYFSLLDPASESRNFETTGKTAYLYYTRQNFGQGSLDRDLIRVAVEFYPSEAEAGKRIVSTSEPTTEPMTLSILKKEFSVPVNTPVELTFGWETQTAEQTADFLSNLQFVVLLDDKPLPNLMSYWGEIKARGNGRYGSQWLHPVGILSPGRHTVIVKMTLTKVVSDGLGSDLSGVFFENTVQINVGN